MWSTDPKFKLLFLLLTKMFPCILQIVYIIVHWRCYWFHSVYHNSRNASVIRCLPVPVSAKCTTDLNIFIVWHKINICVHLSGTGTWRHLITDALWEFWYGEFVAAFDQKPCLFVSSSFYTSSSTCRLIFQVKRGFHPTIGTQRTQRNWRNGRNDR